MSSLFSHGFWAGFWLVALLVSGAAFAAITLVVAVRGAGEMVRLFRRQDAPAPRVRK